LICLLAMLWPALLLADSGGEGQVVGRIVHVRGQVEVIRAQKGVREKAAPDLALHAGDEVLTGPDGRASIILADETLVQLNVRSRLAMEQVAATSAWMRLRKILPAAYFSAKSLYRMLVGEVWIRNKNRDAALEVKTPSLSMGIRGTEFDLAVGDDGTVVLSVLEGSVKAWNDLGAVEVKGREQVVARPGTAPQKRLLVSPEDAVQWTLSIPSVITDRDIPSTDPERGPLADGLSRLLGGEVTRARETFLDVTGRRPENPLAWGLLGLADLVLGRKTEALEAAQRAVGADPRSTVAWIVLSYARQALFDLEGAVEAIRKVLELDAENVIALTNLSRLLFGADRVSEAWELIQEAERLAPQEAEVHSVAGFILLARRDVEAAEDAFRRAIRLDPASGEPRLGLGLARMRRGDVAGAMEEISTAVLLEPRRSLFLSYWAKMLHQLKRFDQALELLGTAQELDPRDPTPHLYRAIILRDLNRPTEAVEAMNVAMALNDNRAVYRSRFLLDRDLATKSVDLSILYSELGLSAWARNKAMASVKQDFTNFAGHIFLSGALLGLEGRGGAGSSELLQGQLLMPANSNSFNTFNEYTSFFERPSVSGEMSGSVGNLDHRAGRFAAYGGIPSANLAFNLGGSYVETDGWRENDFYRFSDLVGMFKWDPTPNDGLMFIMTHPNTKSGDIGYEVDFPPDPYRWDRNRFTRTELGYHHHFGPQSDLLFFFTRVKMDGSMLLHSRTTLLIPPPPPFLLEGFQYIDYHTPYFQAQGQYRFRLGEHQIILGTVQHWGEHGAESETRSYLELLGFRFRLPVSWVGHDLDTRFHSYYVQDTWKVAPWLTLEAALYSDHMNQNNVFSGTEWAIHEFDPRLGVIIEPTSSDTVRLAAFRYITPFEARRLDPTDTAGVTIFRSTLEGSIAQEADLVWEHEWSSGFFSLNPFYLDREYSYKARQAGVERMVTTRGRVKGMEGALNQILWHGLGLNLGYRYMEVDDENSPEASRKDHMASAGLSYLHPCGFFASVMETYRHEDLKAPGRRDEDIWLTDGQLGYIFPGRRGSASIAVRNIFDRRFNWVTDLFVFQGRVPAREIVGTVSINF
jgi:tetratricopeptide (TPR) repeat protein